MKNYKDGIVFNMDVYNIYFFLSNKEYFNYNPDFSFAINNWKEKGLSYGEEYIFDHNNEILAIIKYGLINDKEQTSIPYRYCGE